MHIIDKKIFYQVKLLDYNFTITIKIKMK